MTGAALQALNAPGNPPPGESQRRGARVPARSPGTGRGLPERPGEGESNVASTAWATQGLWAAGENPETWVQGSGREPLRYMESLQQPDGHIRYRAREDLNGVWMTAYVAPAFAGQPLPIPPVPRATQSTSAALNSATPTPTPGSAEHGQGGESSQPGGGVIAGGGGAGAPLFSRPQPQSKGRKPGGRRQLRSTRTQAAAHESARKRRDPGARQSGGQEVKGVLLNAGDPGTPGLRGAGAGGDQTPWLAIGIADALLLCAFLGTQIERRRPQVIL